VLRLGHWRGPQEELLTASLVAWFRILCAWEQRAGCYQPVPRRVWFDERLLINFVRRCRERWKDFELLRFEERRSKQVLYVRLQGLTIKLIVYRDGRIRAYGEGAGGLVFALKRVAERVLGVDK